MSVNSQIEWEATREKLCLLEESYEAARVDPSGTAHTRELELRSLKQLINQLKEEMVRFESRAVTLTEVALV